MKQLNTVLPASQEENNGAALGDEREPLLLDKVRQKYSIYGSISLVFGGAFTLLFYKAYAGINVFLFSALMISLLCLIMKKLSIKLKAGTIFYYSGVLLLGLSTFFTSSDILHFLNILGILFLLDLSLLHQFYEDGRWDFAKHMGKMFSMLIYSIASIAMPVIDGINFLKKTRVLKNDRHRNILLGVVVAFPMLLIITALLSQADLVFAEMANKVFGIFFSADIFWVTIMFVYGFFACYCILCGAIYKVGHEEKKAMDKSDPTIAVTFLLILCIVYVLFCGIQLVYLFSDGLFKLPAQYTFAEYARRGFFELLAVTIINIVLILLCNTLFKESRWLRFLITLMTACTYIMIASATYRMLLYIGAYQLTFLRLFVLLALLIDALILAGIILSQYKKEFPLFNYCVIVISLCYISFSFARPDYFIASYLADHKEILTGEDMNYLTLDLSLDAAPIVLPLLNDRGRWEGSDNKIEDETGMIYDYSVIMKDYYDRIANVVADTGIRDINYSYEKAADTAKGYPNLK